MKQNSNVLVLLGGPDAERDVSIMSGREVAQALRAAQGFAVIERIIDKPNLQQLAELAAETACEVIFPVLHGQWGEGGPLQEFLEQLGVPYVGSSPDASFLAMDKLKTKSLLAAQGVRTPEAAELAENGPCLIEPPLVLKPVDDGSSVDLRICLTDEQIAQARRELHPRRPRLMAEQYVRGREITAGILHGHLLPFIEITPDASVEFYDYEAKYLREDTTYVVDPELPPGIADEAARVAMMGFDMLGCRDIARVDFMLDVRGLWFLELNTMPGFTTHSLVPMAAASLGMDLPQVCSTLVHAAMTRASAKPQAAAM